MPTPSPLSALSPASHAELVNHLDNAWNRTQVTPPILGPDLRSQVVSLVSYSLRMYWLGRTDKMSSRVLPMFAEITQAFVPAAVLAKEPSPPYTKVGQGRILFAGENHNALAHEVMQKVVDAYAVDQGVEPPAPKRRGLFRLF